MWYKQRFSVTREVEAGKSATGSPIKEVQVVIPDLKGDIVSATSDKNVSEMGRTIISVHKLICPMVDLQTDDILTDLETGGKYKVASVAHFRLLPHIEAVVKGGVL